MAYFGMLQPETRNYVIAPTYADARDVCMEGESGLIRCLVPAAVKQWNRSNGQLTLTNGTIYQLYSAEEPERLRGPQGHRAWCFPAGTMIATEHGQVPIEQIRVGDRIWTRKGLRTAYAARLTHLKAETLRIAFVDGRAIECTLDHPVWVQGRGFVAAQDVRAGDQACAMLASFGADGLGMHMGLGTTSMSARNKVFARGSACIAQFGSRLTALFRRVWSYTTGTRTYATTRSKTLSCIRSKRTHRCTKKDGTTRIAQIQGGELWSGSGAACRSRSEFAGNVVRSSARGQTTKFGLSAIVHAWRNGVWTPTQAMMLRVHTAGNSFAQASGHNGFVQDSATLRIRAKNCLKRSKIALHAAVILRRAAQMLGFASGSAPLTTTLTVAGVSKASTQIVYNLSVTDQHEYFANGILVHNCDELAAWRYSETWDQLQFGLRLKTDDGREPQIIATTTPKPKPLITQLLADSKTFVTRGSTFENAANLATSTLAKLKSKYEGTRLGRQELYAEIIDLEEAGIVKRSQLRRWPSDTPLPVFELIVQSMDTAFTEKEEDKKTGERDPSASTAWGLFRHKGGYAIMLLDAWAEQLGMPELVEKTQEDMKARYGGSADEPGRNMARPLFGPGSLRDSMYGRKPDVLVIENKASGPSLRQLLYREGIVAAMSTPITSKLMRLHAVSQYFAAGMVWIPESRKKPGHFVSWADELINQLCTYAGPGSIEHDDLLDTATQALKYFADRNMISATDQTIAARDEHEERVDTRNPYAA